MRDTSIDGALYVRMPWSKKAVALRAKGMEETLGLVAPRRC